MRNHVPATYGGPEWKSRQLTHVRDVEDGFIWHRCGSSSEVDRLRSVVLARPHPGMFGVGDPDDHLLLEWPDPQKLYSQAESIKHFYETQGINVYWAHIESGFPNFLFQRDLFFMTPEGAVLARPASLQRSGEARFAAMLLSKLGIPLLATPRGKALFEGADALWLTPKTILVGVGLRTNLHGADFISGLVRDMGIDCIRVAVPHGVQHLLGIVNFLDSNLAAVRSDTVTKELLTVLRDFGIETISCNTGREISESLGMNFVTLSPREIVMPSGCPRLCEQLRSSGVTIHELEISEYCKAAGGLACLTGIIHRAS